MFGSVVEYRLAAQSLKDLKPNPFEPHHEGPWHERHFLSVAEGIERLLKRVGDGALTKECISKGKDNGRDKHDKLSYWLYYQHHPGDEKWKLLGQRYRSVEAWQAWKVWLAEGNEKFPKRASGDQGLVSEHVVPKAVLKSRILADSTNLHYWLERNLCCVVTKREDRGLERHTHPDPANPWRRYQDKNIVLLHNPAWKDCEIEALLRHGLLNERSFQSE